MPAWRVIYNLYRYIEKIQIYLLIVVPYILAYEHK